MVKVNWTAQAINDINSVAEYIAQDSRHFAEIQVERFFSHVLILERKPLAGRIVPEFQDKKIREVIVGNYRIVYRIVSTLQVDILTVHHSARLLKRKTVRSK